MKGTKWDTKFTGRNQRDIVFTGKKPKRWDIHKKPKKYLQERKQIGMELKGKNSVRKRIHRKETKVIRSSQERGQRYKIITVKKPHSRERKNSWGIHKKNTKEIRYSQGCEIKYSPERNIMSPSTLWKRCLRGRNSVSNFRYCCSQC